MRPVIKFILVCMLFSSILSAGIINVPADIDSIQGGINLANPGDTVLVQPGTYVETINFNDKNIVVGSLILTTGDTSYISQTIIDGDTSLSPVVSFISGEDSSAKLIGFTIRHKAIYDVGRGISIINSSPHCSYLLIKNNREYLGGGVFCESSNARFMHMRVHSNHSPGNRAGPVGGGGYFIGNSNIVLYDVKISQNRGGGVWCENSHLILTDVEINQNICVWGGGIYSDSSDLTLNNVVISEDTARGNYFGSGSSPGYGGGISLTNYSSVILNNVQIKNNITLGQYGIGGEGGGIFCENSNLYLINVSIADNSSGYGGGICSGRGWIDPPDSSNIYLSNVSITNNSALATTNPGGMVYFGFGGGIYSKSGASVSFDQVYKCNIYNNYADSLGNDLYTNGDSLISVIVDTFTVLNPDSFHAYPFNKFTFDILHDPLGATAISQQTGIMPANYTLKQNHPNPFNPSTTIEFTLPKSEFVVLKIYNILGKEVSTLVSKRLNQGNHTYIFDGTNLASGIYYYQLVAGKYREVKKMILIK